MMSKSDKEIKASMMATMIADLVGIADSPQAAFALADHLIRRGWRKAEQAINAELLEACKKVENILNTRDETAWFPVDVRIALKQAIAKGEQ